MLNMKAHRRSGLVTKHSYIEPYQTSHPMSTHIYGPYQTTDIYRSYQTPRRTSTATCTVPYLMRQDALVQYHTRPRIPCQRTSIDHIRRQPYIDHIRRHVAYQQPLVQFRISCVKMPSYSTILDPASHVNARL